MKNKIKAVFFDVDGTLLAHPEGIVPESTKRALKKLRDQGIKVIVATGRHTQELQELPVKILDFDGYVTLNGQLCLDAEKRVIYDAPISPADTRTMVSIFEQKQIPTIVVEKDRLYINYVDDLVRRRQREISSPVPEVSAYRGSNVYQFAMYVGKEEAEQISRQLKSCTVTSWTSDAYDVISMEGGKRKGIQRLIANYGISRDEIMAFGDGENDIDMLQYAQIGVALGDANEKVKACADYVTDRVMDDGIEKALL